MNAHTRTPNQNGIEEGKEGGELYADSTGKTGEGGEGVGLGPV